MDYQQIYTDEDWYGNAHIGRCPGNRLYPQYKSWLKGKILDVVIDLRKKSKTFGKVFKIILIILDKILI